MTYGIKLIYSGPIPPSPVEGWILDGRKPATFDDSADAERAARRLRRDPRYTRNGCRIEAAERQDGKR